METIPLTKAKEGMVLAREIRNEKGIILCQRGTKLTTSLIEKLKSMGIPNVTVASKKSKKELEKRLSSIEERLSLVELRDKDMILEAVREALEEMAS